MEDLTVGLLHSTLLMTLNVLRDGDVKGAEVMLEDVCDTLESYLKEGK